jgi:NAD(P)-dependent dehydrogenase (short-subunit alcohol dehydrogenase family)
MIMQESFLEGRTALVTGSVQGIGLAIGKALSSQLALVSRSTALRRASKRTPPSRPCARQGPLTPGGKPSLAFVIYRKAAIAFL